MDLIRFDHRKDWGDDFYFQILNFGKHWPQPFKRRSLLQFSISWNDSASWPYIQITSGCNGLLGIVMWVYKFGLDVDIISTTWKFDHLSEITK